MKLFFSKCIFLMLCFLTTNRVFAAASATPPTPVPASAAPNHTVTSSLSDIDKLLGELVEALKRAGYDASTINAKISELRLILNYMLSPQRPVTVSIHGEGNAGKTTLFQSLLGLEQLPPKLHAPTSTLDVIPNAQVALPNESLRSAYGTLTATQRSVAQLWILDNAPVYVDDSLRLTLIDTPSFTNSAHDGVVAESLFFSDYVLLLVPDDYNSKTFQEFLKNVRASEQRIAFVFNRQNQVFNKMSDAELEGIVKEIVVKNSLQNSPLAEGTLLVVESADATRKLPFLRQIETSSMRKAKVAVAGAELSSMQVLGHVVAKDVNLKNQRDERVLRAKRLLETTVGLLQKISSFSLKLMADFEKFNVALDETNFSEHPLRIAVLDSIKRTDSILSRNFIAAGRLWARFGGDSKFVRTEAALGQEEHLRQVAFVEQERKVFLGIFRDLLKTLEDLKGSVEASGEVRKAIDLLTSASYSLDMQERLIASHQKLATVDSETRESIDAYVAHLRESRPAEFYALLTNVSNDHFWTLGTGAALYAGLPLATAWGVHLVASSAVIAAASGVVVTGLAWVITPMIVAKIVSGRHSSIGGDLIARLRQELNRVTDSTDKASSEVTIKDFVNIHYRSRAKWIAEWLQKNYLKPLILAVAKTNKALPQETLKKVQELPRMLEHSCAVMLGK